MVGRTLVVAIALLAELCASAGPTLLTLCIHEDGKVRYEPTLALCCQQNEQGQSECCSHDEAKPFTGHDLSPEDACRDYSVVFTQIRTSVSSIRQLLSEDLGICELLPVVARVPGLPIVGSLIANGDCGPPGHHTLQDLSTVVLRL